MKTYAANRVIVRPIVEADLEALMDVNGDPEVTRYLPYPTWQTAEDARKWYDRMMGLQSRDGAEQYVIAERASDRAIGTALLFRFDEPRQHAELGYTLARSFWGKGYAREALSAVMAAAAADGMKSFKAVIDARNEPSWRLVERLGFRRTGQVEGFDQWVCQLGERTGAGR